MLGHGPISESPISESLLRIAGDATLSAPPALAAAALERLTGSATLSNAAALAGLAVERLIASGTLQAPGSLAAVAVERLTGSAALSAPGALAALGRERLTATGGLSSFGALAATVREVLRASGTLAAPGSLAATGSTTLRITGTGAFAAATGLAGTVTITLPVVAAVQLAYLLARAPGMQVQVFGMPGMQSPTASTTLPLGGIDLTGVTTPPSTKTQIPMPGFGLQAVNLLARTHYVDNTNPNSTDVSNPFGTPAVPRKTVPTTLAAGSVVDVVQSLYAANVTYTCNGTLAQPVVIRAIGTPYYLGDGISSYVRFDGAYVILEGINFAGTQVVFGGVAQALRNCEVTAIDLTAVVPLGISFVASNAHIHHNGQADSLTEDDDHGILVSPGTALTWILDCHIHHNGGDAIQIGQAGTDQAYAAGVFIRGCTLHEDRENAIDIKRAQDVIACNNVIYGYQARSSSAGEMVIVHNNAQRVWLINNIAGYATRGFVCTQAAGMFMIGNYIFGVTDATDDPNSYYGAHGITVYGSTGVYLVNNTITACDGGISIPNSTTVEVVNNAAALRIAGTVGAVQKTNALAPVVNGGTAHSIYDVYKALYLVPLDVDLLGNPRLRGGAIDIGALEAA